MNDLVSIFWRNSSFSQKIFTIVSKIFLEKEIWTCSYPLFQSSLYLELRDSEMEKKIYSKIIGLGKLKQIDL